MKLHLRVKGKKEEESLTCVRAFCAAVALPWPNFEAAFGWTFGACFCCGKVEVEPKASNPVQLFPPQSAFRSSFFTAGRDLLLLRWGWTEVEKITHCHWLCVDTGSFLFTSTRSFPLRTHPAPPVS
jgi:hypothetical protein